MLRYVVLLYGLACYAVFLLVFLYAVGFIGGFIVPTKLDGPATASLGEAVAIDLLLVLLFALQHSVMARPAFKRQWTRLVPESAERSTYVLATCIAMGLMFWFWQPLGGIVWDMHGPVLRATMWALFGIGWLLVLVATFLINHFDLFGLRQVWLQFRGQPYTPLHFATPGPYRIVRHPLYVGWLLVFWAAPTMTAAHLLFAASLTLYILIAIRFEERDLVAFHPDYAEYRRRVPMLIPRWR